MTARPDERRAVLALCLVQLVDVLGVTVTVTALPMMLHDVHARAGEGSLVATGYALFFGGLLMFGARLGDRVGHRRTVLASLVVFAVGAVLATAAQDVATLTLARCLQGAAAAAAVPSALHLLTVVTRPEARARAVAAWSAAGAVAGATGFVVGGAVGAVAGWRPVFGGFVVVALLLALAVQRWVPATAPPRARVPLAPWASFLVTASVMAAVLGSTLAAEPGRGLHGAGLVALAAALAAAFVAVDRRSTVPLVPPQVVRVGSVRSGLAASFVNTATTGAAVTLVTLHLQDRLGLGPLLAAAVLLPFSLAVVLGAVAAARLLRTTRPELVCAAGLGLVATGIAALLVAPSVAVVTAVCVAVAGAGIGVSSVPATSLATDVGEDVRATASGLVNTTAQLGSALGIAAGLLVAATTTGIPTARTEPPRVTWALAALVAAGTALVLARARRADPAAGVSARRPRRPR